MFKHMPLLSILIWLPIFGAIPVAMLNDPEQANRARILSLVIGLISLMLCIPLYFIFDTTTAVMQFTEHLSWIPRLKINYDLGVDGISMPLVVLTCFTTLLVVLSSWTMVKKKVGQYLSAFLVMQGAVVGVFSSLDAMLFYFFWEAILIPMYLSIGIWGMEKRSYAAIKFFLYTFFGSALLLVTLLYLRIHSGSFYIPDYYRLRMGMAIQILVFLGFFFFFCY